jgi:hypothetical protein
MTGVAPGLISGKLWAAALKSIRDPAREKSEDLSRFPPSSISSALWRWRQRHRARRSRQRRSSTTSFPDEIVDCDLREFIGELKSQLEQTLANG